MKKSMIGKVILMDIPTLKSPRYALITDILKDLKDRREKRKLGKP